MRLGIVSAAGGETVWIDWDREKYPYLAHVTWEKNCPLSILVQNREQTEEVLYRVDEKSGAIHELLTRDRCGVAQPGARHAAVAEGWQRLFVDDRADGEWTLELRSPTGELVRTLTPPEFRLARPGRCRASSKASLTSPRAGDPTRDASVFRAARRRNADATDDRAGLSITA